MQKLSKKAKRFAVASVAVVVALSVAVAFASLHRGMMIE